MIWVLLTGCSTRNPRPVFVPQVPNSGSSKVIPRGTVEEHTLAAYKSYYEQFRHIPSVDSTLSIQQEAKLSEEYANAREAFNYWLWFVTDNIQKQSELEPPGAEAEPPRRRTKHPVSEYRARGTAALSAVRAFDTDLREILHVDKPPELSSPPAEPYSLGYSLVTVFDDLRPDRAQIAGEELMRSYSWDKP